MKRLCASTAMMAAVTACSTATDRECHYSAPYTIACAEDNRHGPSDRLAASPQPDQPGEPDRNEPDDHYHPDHPDNRPDRPSGNPGNDKDVGNAGENPNGKGGWGDGDKGMSG